MEAETRTNGAGPAHGNAGTAPEADGCSSPLQLRRTRKFPRSKGGCLTCKRRKVKCDESQPLCSHCERLNMPCRWQTSSKNNGYGTLPNTASPARSNSVAETPHVLQSTAAGASPGASLYRSQSPQGSAEFFDYASLVWGSSNNWPPGFLEMGPDMGLDNQTESGFEDPNHVQGHHTALPGSLPSTSLVTHDASDRSNLTDANTRASQDMAAQETPENLDLINYFIHVVTPPILSEVESQKNWLTMRRILTKMAGDSRMVRWAVLAFSNVMLCRRDGEWMASQQNYYGNAVAEISAYEQETEALVKHSSRREKLFATMFFLSYVDILEARIEDAHRHLKQAHIIFQKAQRGSIAPIEKQFFLWFRLLDARTVAAGGEGLFLADEDEELLVMTSPASYNGEDMVKDDPNGSDIEDEIFQVLYQPGYIFFQKVQGFVGRIAKIDPWHRSRGSVEDETEVMSIAASIAADLRLLYEQRHSFIDIAVAGKLTAPHISAHLAFTITRAFRTYLSCYYASKIHLHRVAYKTFPLTAESVEAMNQIRRLARLIAEGLDGDDPMPINMLWPLLLLGTEEKEPDDRAFIKRHILRMEKIVGHARITAQVLEEVQTRQDASKTRVDIGLVMREIFNTRFAVV